MIYLLGKSAEGTFATHGKEIVTVAHVPVALSALETASNVRSAPRVLVRFASFEERLLHKLRVVLGVVDRRALNERWVPDHSFGRDARTTQL